MNVRTVIVTTIVIVAIHVLVIFLVMSQGSVPDVADGLSPEQVFGPEKTAETERQPSEIPLTEEQPSPAVKVPEPVPAPVTKRTIPVQQPAAPAPAVKTPAPIAKETPAPAPTPVKTGNRKPVHISPEPFRPLIFKGAKTGNPDNKAVLRGITAKRATGILIDLDSRQVLWQKDVERVVPIASLSKLMVLLISCEILSDPTTPYTLDTPVAITKEARNVPPSGVAFQKNESSFPMELLLVAAAVKSANDATYLVAQTLGGGSAAAFVEMMNERAKRLGMKNTHFFNPHGLNEKKAKNDNRSTVLDLVRLSEACLAHPEICRWTSMNYATFRTKNDLKNHNHRLLTGAKGTTGLKTGYTQRAGFCVSAVCQRKNRRLLAIVTGFSTARERDDFVRLLFDWGFQH